MKSQWRCRICEKALSTKQNIEKHLEKLHPGYDRTQKQYTVEFMTRDEINTSNPKKQIKTSKSAYSFFSGMKNIFTQKGLCKDLTLYPQTSATSLPEQTLNDNSSSSYPGYTVETQLDENTVAGIENNPNEKNKKEDEALPEPSTNLCESVQSSSLVVDPETTSGLLPTPLDTAFDESPPPTPGVEVINQADMSPSLSPPVADTMRFRAPFKTRGGCGCDKCSRENCGVCFSCLNRSKTK